MNFTFPTTWSGLAGVLRNVAAGFGIAISGNAIHIASMSNTVKAVVGAISGGIFWIEHHNQRPATIEKTSTPPSPPA